jgi:hypothetical protein
VAKAYDKIHAKTHLPNSLASRTVFSATRASVWVHWATHTFTLLRHRLHQSTGFSLGALSNPHIHPDASPRLRLRTISSTNFIPKGQHVRRLFSHSSFGLFCLAFLEPRKVIRTLLTRITLPQPTSNGLSLREHLFPNCIKFQRITFFPALAYNFLQLRFRTCFQHALLSRAAHAKHNGRRKRSHQSLGELS